MVGNYLKRLSKHFLFSEANLRVFRWMPSTCLSNVVPTSWQKQVKLFNDSMWLEEKKNYLIAVKVFCGIKPWSSLQVYSSPPWVLLIFLVIQNHNHGISGEILIKLTPFLQRLVYIYDMFWLKTHFKHLRFLDCFDFPHQMQNNPVS